VMAEPWRIQLTTDWEPPARKEVARAEERWGYLPLWKHCG
jgi:hypothetical protein